jgi:hypothetical protein
MKWPSLSPSSMSMVGGEGVSDSQTMTAASAQPAAT